MKLVCSLPRGEDHLTTDLIPEPWRFGADVWHASLPFGGFVGLKIVIGRNGQTAFSRGH